MINSKFLVIMYFMLFSCLAIAAPQNSSFQILARGKDVIKATTVTPCDKTFHRPKFNICVDSKDGQKYGLITQASCTINPEAKNVPEWVKNYCSGQVHSYTPGMTELAEMQVKDKQNPHQLVINFIHLQMGNCAADLKYTNMSELAGNIYSCNQLTRKFEVRKATSK